jgi:hypothetical protein
MLDGFAGVHEDESSWCQGGTPAPHFGLNIIDRNSA